MVEVSIAESNARAEALGRFVRWLYRRYQKLDLVEMANIADPIELRQVFVPMRVGRKDISDEEMGRDLNDVHKERLPGRAAWDVLAKEPLVLLSGRPGSGKTTLVHAIVAELCGERPSHFREHTRAIPVPLILRSFENLEQIGDLSELLKRWWPLQLEQAERDKMSLDQTRLQERLFPDNGRPEIPVLLLFDGIDEIGGRDTRQRLLNIAVEAKTRGYRVLVTGRPTGYQDLLFHEMALNWEGGEDSPRPAIHYLLPLAWPQIDQFIHSWYGLRDEWERQRKQGIERFLEHLADRGRSHLLSLARRPIFLTLMALVHCTQNQMPEGRPLLYRQIIDLYLERQERHRQRNWSVEGKPMPHWPATETRLVLGHLAWKSQTLAAESERSWDVEMRRVVWKREEMVSVIRSQIDARIGRFDVLKASDAPALVSYFLHPAGLLIEPTADQVQFAHLSFQEYLCAWFLHEQGKVDEMRPYLCENLFPLLEKPGWEEVAMLVLCIHAEETGRQGHFKMLRWLDLSNSHQASLFLAALTGRELPFTTKERSAWLPVAFACALIHPGLGREHLITTVSEWRDEALSLLIQLAETRSGEEMWNRLKRSLEIGDLGRAKPPFLTFEMERRWMNPPNDKSWEASFGVVEAQAHSFLQLCNAGWFATDASQPIPIPALRAALDDWLEAFLMDAGAECLWDRQDNVPGPTAMTLELEGLLPDRGRFWKLLSRQVPVDVWLLQGEQYGSSSLIFSQASILSTILPKEKLPARNTLALLLYQAQILLEGAARGDAFREWAELRLRLQLQSQMKSLLWGADFLWSLSRFGSLMRSQLRSYLLMYGQLRSSWRSQSLLLLQSLAPSKTFPMVQPSSQEPSWSLSIELESSLSSSSPLLVSLSWSQKPKLLKSQLLAQSQSLHQSLSLSGRTKSDLGRFLGVVGGLASKENWPEVPFGELVLYAFRAATFNWFSEEAGNPELMRIRGLLAGEPLPRSLGLFDEAGIPFLLQRRENWLALQKWLQDEDAILAFTFPQGLPESERALLLKDLTTLRKQPWAPHRGLEAMLKDWPEDQPERDISLEAADRALAEACQRALEELERPKKRKSRKRGDSR